MEEIQLDTGAGSTSLILETIDQLRKRKARPDRERICHMLQRKHGIPPQQTAADLERLVDAEIVVKVDYKGNTSYRNAAKWRKSHMGHVLNSNEVQGLLRQAVVEVGMAFATKQENSDSVRLEHSASDRAECATSAQPTSTTPDSDTKSSDEGALLINTGEEDVEADGTVNQEGGENAEAVLPLKTEAEKVAAEGIVKAAFPDIEMWLRQRDPGTALTGKHLFQVLKREVEAGRLARRLHDGFFTIGMLFSCVVSIFIRVRVAVSLEKKKKVIYAKKKDMRGNDTEGISQWADCTNHKIFQFFSWATFFL